MFSTYFPHDVRFKMKIELNTFYEYSSLDLLLLLYLELLSSLTHAIYSFSFPRSLYLLLFPSPFSIFFSLFLNTRFHFECVYGPYYLLVYYLFKTHDKISCFQKVFSNAVASVSFSPKHDTFIPLRVELQVMGQCMSQLMSWSPIHFIWGLCLYLS